MGAFSARKEVRRWAYVTSMSRCCPLKYLLQILTCKSGYSNMYSICATGFKCTADGPDQFCSASSAQIFCMRHVASITSDLHAERSKYLLQAQHAVVSINEYYRIQTSFCAPISQNTKLHVIPWSMPLLKHSSGIRPRSYRIE